MLIVSLRYGAKSQSRFQLRSWNGPQAVNRVIWTGQQGANETIKTNAEWALFWCCGANSCCDCDSEAATSCSKLPVLVITAVDPWESCSIQRSGDMSRHESKRLVFQRCKRTEYLILEVFAPVELPLCFQCICGTQSCLDGKVNS